ncbi:DNA primase [Staphylococcus coagulans]|nr:DNA primase [Staphylococcus coagulans]
MALKVKDNILRVNEDNIPKELKEIPSWVLWCAEWNEKQQNYSKVPYSDKGYRASSNNMNAWTDFNTAYNTR